MPPTATETHARTAPRPSPAAPPTHTGHHDGREVNVGTLERIGSGVLGAALTLAGLLLMVRRRSILGGASLAATGAGLAYRGASGHCAAYEAMGVSTSDATSTSHPLSRFVHVSQRTRINRPAHELYSYWRDLANLPRIMRHLHRVEVRDDGKSHWVAIGPRGHMVEWDAQITEDRPNELIAWRADDNAEVPNHGHVRFESPSDGHGSIVEVSLDYRPPAGVLGAAVAYAFGRAPSQQVHEDLRRFKQLMETGETATNTGQPRGRCG